MFVSKINQFKINRFIKRASEFSPLETEGYNELFRLLRNNGKKAVRKSLGLKLLLVSDTHGYLAFGEHRFPKFLDTIGDFDLCVLLGDIHPVEMEKIIDCIPRENIIGVKGNHDTFSIYSDFGVRDISGTVYEYKGVRFAGLDGSFGYKEGSYPSHTQYESLEISKSLPKADVLITHDMMFDDSGRDMAHCGLIGITHYIYTNSVGYHIHGHIHKSYENEYSNGTMEKSVHLCEYFEI